MTQTPAHILACVDQSEYATAVADHCAWLVKRLALPVDLLHVIERHPRLSEHQDHSGALGVDAQDHLLHDLSDADAQRSRQAREEGRLLLTGLRERLSAAGVLNVDIRQRHGDVEETLLEHPQPVAHVVLGRKGSGKHAQPVSETPLAVLRAMREPVWLLPPSFVEPRRALIAFDGSMAMRRTLQRWADGPLLKGLEITVLMAGDAPKAEAVDSAVATLQASGLQAQAMTQAGAPEEVIAKVVREGGFDVLLMGAYSHAFWRSFIMGSQTQEILSRVDIAAMVQRY